ncbi:hypothetical protein BGZ52_003818 [Haplosporangium bisporale]|nr:hypothetical protein BGZ52_003818 [Haplosporangium bisporale]KAF9212727.1 hypothetical protein BGZ59_006384 [Podila verticillata]KFH71632.1 hypothetical protein MVEG_01928 [Podila verticillata NRRL 6337]
MPINSRIHHSPGSIFVLSTRSTGIIAAISVGIAAAARPYGARITGPGLLLSVGALQCCWLGANMAISFLEAPVKFVSPTPSRRNLVDVGRHVFSAMNKVEVVLAALDIVGWHLVLQRGLVPSAGSLSSSSFLGLRQLGWKGWLGFAPGLIVYVFQSFTFLPTLRSVGARFVEGKPVENAKVHGVYVGLEALKITALVASTIGIGRALLKA